MPRLLLIGGEGRNIGKTTLGCHLIRRWKASWPIAAVKVSPHRHLPGYPMNVAAQGMGYTVWEELIASRKDSGRYLAAGASPVFYVESTDINLEEAFHQIVDICDQGQLFLCESGWMARLINPGVFVYIQDPGTLSALPGKPLPFPADLVVPPDQLMRAANRITIRKGMWRLQRP